MFLDKLIENWPLDLSSAELISAANRSFQEGVCDKVPWSRSQVVNAVFEMCALHHFQFECTEGPQMELVQKAIHSGVEFYYGDWANREEIELWCERFQLNEFDTSRELRRSAMLQAPAKLEPWRDTLSQLMFFCMATEANSKLSRICDWFEVDMLPEYSGLTHEVELTTIILASYFRDKPMIGIDELIAKTSKSKRKHATVRLRLFQACLNGDQNAFSTALPEAIDIYYKKREPCVASDLVAVDESTACLLAKRQGLSIPALTEKQQWAIISIDSIGLGTANER